MFDFTYGQWSLSGYQKRYLLRGEGYFHNFFPMKIPISAGVGVPARLAANGKAD